MISILRTSYRFGGRCNPLILSVWIVLLAAGARFYRLDTQSLWNDEGNSLRLAQRPVGNLIEATGHDIHPPGYYLALKGWIALVGETEFGLRSLSALEGVLAVAVTMALGRALAGQRAGLVAGLVVAFSPFAVYYSQETRMYAQLGLLSAASMAVFVMWVRRVETGRQAWPWALALALVHAAGLYTQYSFPFTLVAQGLGFVGWLVGHAGRARPAMLHYTALNGLALLLFLPWLPTAWDQVTNWPRTGVSLALGEQLRTVFTWMTYGPTAGEVVWARFLWPGLLAGAALWPGQRKDGWRVGLPAVWIVVVTGALFISGAYREANLKFLLPAQVALALLIGAGTAHLWGSYPSNAGNAAKMGNPAERVIVRKGRVRQRIKRVIRHPFFPAWPGRWPLRWRYIRHMLAGVSLFLVLIGQLGALDALYTDPAYARDDYRSIAAQIMAAPQPGDAVILDAPNQWEVFTYYYRGDAPVYPLPRGLGGDNAQTRAEVEAILARHRRIFVVFWGEAERDPNRVVQATLDAGAYPVSSQWYGDVRLAQYAVIEAGTGAAALPGIVRFGDPITLTAYTLSAATVRPGDTLGVILTWQTETPLSARYKVTVQLLAPDGRLAAQHDSEPGNNLSPTNTWTPATPITDPHGLIVPADLAPGVYTLIVGFYNPATPLDRVRVAVDGVAVGDYFTLADVVVREN